MARFGAFCVHCGRIERQKNQTVATPQRIGMSERSELAAGVVEFVTERVGTLEQLDVLTLMMRSPERWWDAAEVATFLGLSPAMARGALERLAAGNLLEITITTDVHYRFQPGTSSLRDAANQFADAWRQHRAEILGIVTDRQRRAIREFSDAFRIRR